MNNKVRLLIMDVDGTLTDGRIYMGEYGEAMKAFDVKDGCGIKEILPQFRIVPVIITARSSRILKNRCSELGIEHLYQNTRDKLGKIDDVLRMFSANDGGTYTYANCAYIGDDILDIPCLTAVGEGGGLAACPADAVQAVKNCCGYICKASGGHGAVREFIDWIVQQS